MSKLARLKRFKRRRAAVMASIPAMIGTIKTYRCNPCFERGELDGVVTVQLTDVESDGLRLTPKLRGTHNATQRLVAEDEAGRIAVLPPECADFVRSCMEHFGQHAEIAVLPGMGQEPIPMDKIPRLL